MEMNNYKESFTKLVDECVKNQEHVGEGNPDAKILIVGKEAAISKSDAVGYNRYRNNAIYWQNGAPKEEREATFKPNYSDLLGGHTWKKYQKLNDYIFSENKSDFKDNFFVAEISDNPNKNSAVAQKKDLFRENLQRRKTTFLKSDFIQQFPVVVLACGNYIQNNEVREIDEIFEVEFDKKYPKNDTPNSQAFWTHYNSDKTKLVIHTRQLSMNVTDELLKKMARVITEFLEVTE